MYETTTTYRMTRTRWRESRAHSTVVLSDREDNQSYNGTTVCSMQLHVGNTLGQAQIVSKLQTVRMIQPVHYLFLSYYAGLSSHVCHNVHLPCIQIWRATLGEHFLLAKGQYTWPPPGRNWTRKVKPKLNSSGSTTSCLLFTGRDIF
jgi:hypothetical protein